MMNRLQEKFEKFIVITPTVGTIRKIHNGAIHRAVTTVLYVIFTLRWHTEIETKSQSRSIEQQPSAILCA